MEIAEIADEVALAIENWPALDAECGENTTVNETAGSASFDATINGRRLQITLKERP